MPRPLKPLDPYASWPALFGAAVQLLRLRLRAKPAVSQHELGKRIGFDGSTVSAVERGVLRPDEKFVEGCERELPAAGMLSAMSPFVTAEWGDWERLGVTPLKPGAGSRGSMTTGGPIVDQAAVLSRGLRLITSYGGLLTEMREVVQGAEEYLVVTGSRSRDKTYLDEIEIALSKKPEVVHYRLLFGFPHHRIFKEHLLRLLELRDPKDRVGGIKRLCIGIFEDVSREPERFICASEKRAVLAIPSLVTAGNFDSGIVFLEPDVARCFVQHVKQVYGGTRRLDTVEAVRELPIQR